MSAQKIALFVSEEKLKNFTTVNQNVSPADLVPNILTAQDTELQFYLGSTFYFSIQDQVLNGTVNTNNQFLLDNYISKALIQWGLMRALPNLKYKIYNKSVLSPTAENADSITLEELQFLQQQCRDTGNTYATRMVEWIQLHPGDYPVYFSQKVTDGMMPSYADPIYGGLVTSSMPYAWKKRWGMSRNWVNDGMNGCCEGLFPNTYVNTTVF
jgi:hypothetical protein